MVRPFTRCPFLPSVVIVLLALLGVTAARADDSAVRHETFAAAGRADHAIAIREHAGWNAACEPIDAPSLTLDAPPHHGRVCARVETITIRSLYAGTVGACIGHRVRGVRLEYRPDNGFAGADALRYAVQYPSVRRAIDVSVTVKGEGASQQVAALPLLPRQQAGPVPPCADLMF
ncbi:MAG TPA: hypothetical protein VG986_19150 [Pseudolabrys sp.]|nr:hypothetical protein [Pseudolabrys sp.]